MCVCVSVCNKSGLKMCSMKERRRWKGVWIIYEVGASLWIQIKMKKNNEIRSNIFFSSSLIIEHWTQHIIMPVSFMVHMYKLLRKFLPDLNFNTALAEVAQMPMLWCILSILLRREQVQISMSKTQFEYISFSAFFFATKFHKNICDWLSVSKVLL